MQNAGIDAHSKKYETEKYIEYKVRINKLWKEPNQILMNLTDSSVDCSQTCFCFILVKRFLPVSQ